MEIRETQIQEYKESKKYRITREFSKIIKKEELIGMKE